MEVSFQCRDGLCLRGEALGPASGPAAVLLHGGGQTRLSWGATASALAAGGRRSIAIDLRGHGDSDWSVDGDYLPPAFAADVADVVSQLDRPPVLIGASLGGLASLLALAEHGAAAEGLVLVDVAHRYEPAGAQRIVDFMRATPEGFADPAEAAAAVSRYLPHRQRSRRPAGIEPSLRLRDGRWHWHWDPRLLDASGPLLDRASAEAISRRLVEALSALRIPTMLVRGAISDVVSDSIAEEFAALVPHARVVDVGGAAHMVAGDDNDLFTAAVVEFLDGIEAAQCR